MKTDTFPYLENNAETWSHDEHLMMLLLQEDGASWIQISEKHSRITRRPTAVPGGIITPGRA